MKVTDDYVFFYTNWLSQWYTSPFTSFGIKFNNCEQFMMYCKAKLFDDTSIAKKILQADSPETQKALGRKVKNYDDSVWSSVRYDCVVVGNYYKFKDEVLKNKLLELYPRTFVEASEVDLIWGIGRGEDYKHITDPKTWRGKNLLGKAITEVAFHFSYNTIPLKSLKVVNKILTKHENILNNSI